ncbi:MULTISPECIES: hypothetical protein [unclassified Bradyrhizobium]|uniref:hypothetical protein n=1 Tax=unclassified Bradyrhizobium TaxID=2631580 RepID=UPI0028EA70E0|nr:MULTISPECIES: hypothetical protein [unclassified Bradyrhizobium]
MGSYYTRRVEQETKLITLFFEQVNKSRSGRQGEACIPNSKNRATINTIEE